MSVYLMFLVVHTLIVTRTSFYILMYTGKISTHYLPMLKFRVRVTVCGWCVGVGVGV